VVTPLYAFASFIFIAGGRVAFTAVQLEIHMVTWKHTALLLGGLVALVAGAVRSRRKETM